MLETKILFVGEGRQPAQAWWAAAQMGAPPVGAGGEGRVRCAPGCLWAWGGGGGAGEGVVGITQPGA